MNIWTPDDSARARQIGGLLKRTAKLGGWFFRRRGSDQDEAIPVWDETEVVVSCPIVPKAERKTQPSLRELEKWDIDQGRSSGCAVASFANLLQFHMAKLGRAMTPINWWDVYIELTGGRGGVEIGTVLSYAMSKGFPTEDGQSRIVVTEAWDAASREAIVSGLQRGCTVTVGHDVHAECAVTEIVEADGREYLDIRGTWGQNYPSFDKGWHVFPLDRVELAYGSAIVREIELRPADVTDLPDAKE